MDKKRATLKDVADAVGVHVSTASRALHPKTRHLITDELAAKIVSAARELEYRPNSIAYSLRTRRSMTIGVLVPDITNPLFPPIVRGLEDVLVPRGYTALVVNTDDNAAKAATHIQMLRGRGVDGLVVANAERRDRALIRLAEEELPIVTVNRTADEPRISAVINDEEAGIRAAVNHLYGLGHRCIAHIAGPQALSTGLARRKSFEASIAALRLEASPKLIAESVRYREDEGRRCAEALLDNNPGVTAVVAGNDLLALGAIGMLDDKGLACPRDVSVTGFNDMPLMDRLTPPLTTVRTQPYQTGRRAAEMILEQIETPVGARKSQSEVLPVELVLRGSTGPAPD